MGYPKVSDEKILITIALENSLSAFTDICTTMEMPDIFKYLFF